MYFECDYHVLIILHYYRVSLRQIAYRHNIHTAHLFEIVIKLSVAIGLISADFLVKEVSKEFTQVLITECEQVHLVKMHF